MKIKIKNNEYIGQCNALSYIFYKKIFKINIFDDLDKLRSCLVKITESNTEAKEIIKFYELLIKLLYILIYSRNQDVDDFEEWSKDISIEDFTEELTGKIIEVYLESFTDEETAKELEKIPSKNTKESIFPEHDFLKICLSYGLSMQDLKQLTYIDVTKIFISSYQDRQEEKKPKYREATQADWDRLASSK